MRFFDVLAVAVASLATMASADRPVTLSFNNSPARKRAEIKVELSGGPQRLSNRLAKTPVDQDGVTYASSFHFEGFYPGVACEVTFYPEVYRISVTSTHYFAGFTPAWTNLNLTEATVECFGSSPRSSRTGSSRMSSLGLRRLRRLPIPGGEGVRRCGGTEPGPEIIWGRKRDERNVVDASDIMAPRFLARRVPATQDLHLAITARLLPERHDHDVQRPVTDHVRARRRARPRTAASCAVEDIAGRRAHLKPSGQDGPTPPALGSRPGIATIAVWVASPPVALRAGRTRRAEDAAASRRGDSSETSASIRSM
ncbi:unnamed protein product [Diplocarpon coronariae]